MRREKQFCTRIVAFEALQFFQDVDGRNRIVACPRHDLHAQTVRLEFGGFVQATGINLPAGLCEFGGVTILRHRLQAFGRLIGQALALHHLVVMAPRHMRDLMGEHKGQFVLALDRKSVV